MGVFFRASAVNAKRDDDDDDIDALRTNLLLFLCRFFFFLSFVHNKTIRYDPNTFTPNNIIFSPSPCLCLGGGGAGLAHASVTTFSSVFLFSLFCPLFLLSLSLFFLDVYVIWFDDNK